MTAVAPCGILNHMNKTAFLLALSLLATPAATVMAQGVMTVSAPGAPSRAELMVLQKVRTYLQSLNTLQAGFKQTLAGAPSRSGTLWIARPGRLRLEYQPPEPLLMVADGRQFIVYDPSLGQPSYSRLSEQPFAFLLRERVDLRDPALNLRAEERGGRIYLTTTPNGEGSQPMTFIFSSSPLRLQSWEYFDERGQPVKVTLTSVTENKPVNPSLFQFVNPGLQRYQQR
jgi:outer membrane lipoprotein-sorting protein